MSGRAARWPTAVLAMLCAGLGATVVFELTGGLPFAPEVTAAAPGAQPDWSRDAIEFEPPSRDELAVIAERPLFSPSRKPFVAAEQELPPVPVRSLPPLQLIGVLLTEQQRTALVQVVGEGDPSWVREGHEVQGWQVERIEQTRVHVRAGDRLETVELRPDTAVAAHTRLEWRGNRADDVAEDANNDADERVESGEADAGRTDEGPD